MQQQGAVNYLKQKANKLRYTIDQIETRAQYISTILQNQNKWLEQTLSKMDNLIQDGQNPYYQGPINEQLLNERITQFTSNAIQNSSTQLETLDNAQKMIQQTATLLEKGFAEEQQLEKIEQNIDKLNRVVSGVSQDQKQDSIPINMINSTFNGQFGNQTQNNNINQSIDQLYDNTPISLTRSNVYGDEQANFQRKNIQQLNIQANFEFNQGKLEQAMQKYLLIIQQINKYLQKFKPKTGNSLILIRERAVSRINQIDSKKDISFGNLQRSIVQNNGKNQIPMFQEGSRQSFFTVDSRTQWFKENQNQETNVLALFQRQQRQKASTWLKKKGWNT